jgi:glucosamine--fructose-6-phosphate aminotransferase (isomerizing)
VPLTGLFFDLLKELDFAAETLLSTNILDLSQIQRAVAAINGHTLYAVDHLDAEGKPGDDSSLAVVGRGGISLGKPSRADATGRLMGTKKSIVGSGHIYVGQGKSDSAPIVILPLLGEDERIHHLLLVHVAFNEALSVGERKEILGERADAIRDLIQEVNLNWDDRFLDGIPLGVLLGEPVEVIAGKIRERLSMITEQ